MYQRLMYVVCASMVLTLASTSHAVVIGNWEQNLDGWTVGDAYKNAVRFDDVNGVTLGKGSLGIHLAKGDWNQGIIILNVPGQGLLDTFKSNQKISVDVTWKVADWPADKIPGWNGLHMVLNAGGDGWSMWKDLGWQVGWVRGDGDKTMKATWDYAQYFGQMKNLQSVWWLELWLISNCNDPAYGGPVTFYLDNMQLFGGGRATGPQPANAAKDVSIDSILSWEAGAFAASHNLYFGTTQQGVADANLASDPNVLFAKVDTTSFDPNTLQFNKRYFWRVDEVNDTNPNSPWVGPVWAFTTADFIIVDDFEGYDDVCKRIFFAWVDGYGHSGSIECAVQPSSGNATGSTVGNFNPPFAEPTIVHTGRQSMPMDYSNMDRKYSEAVRTWAEPQNWTLNGYDTLKLFVRGRDTNGADRLYVTLEDSRGKAATVVNPDPAILTVVNWTDWVIPASNFTDVNMASIKKMVIGVGDRNNPKSVSGRLYIDDIRVGRKPLGLVAYYALENNTNDGSVNGFNGTVAGDPNFPVTYVGGPAGFGKAMLFAGKEGSQYVSLGTLDPSAATGQLSVSLWAKWNGLSEFWQGLIGKRNAWDVNKMLWQIEADRATGNLQFQRDGAGVGFGSGVALPINVWTHVAVTFDGTTARVYLDGVEKASGGFSFGYDPASNLAIGGSGAGTDLGNPVINPFNGALDEVRIYDRVLSGAEILTLAGK